MNLSEYTARVTAMQERLYRMALLYLGSESAALEAVDETVFRGLKAVSKLREPAFFETWMTRILINACKKELRRLKRETPLEEVLETPEEAFDSLPLKEAIQRLPSDLREVVILRYFADFTSEKTAQILKLPRGTVATRQRRALQLLKLALSEEEYL